MDITGFLVENAFIFAFCLGFLAQVFLYAGEKLRSKWFWLGFFGILAISLFPVKGESLGEKYNLVLHLLFFVIFFGIVAGFILRDKILFKLNEFKFLLFQLVFLYILFIIFGFGLLFFAALIPLVIILFFCISPIVPGFRTRLLLYVWFLINWLVCGIFIWSKFLVNLFIAGGVTNYSPAEYFFFGMSSYVLVMILFFLFDLLPLPGKRESFSQALARAKEMAHAMVAKFDDNHAGIIASIVAVVVVGGILIANVLTGFVSPESLIAFFLCASVFIDYVGGRKTVVEDVSDQSALM